MKAQLKCTAVQIIFIAAVIAFAYICGGCTSAAPKATDVAAKGMYGNAATETVAIGSVKLTRLPDSIESFVAHYSEDTAWLKPSEKTRFLDIYMTGTNCTASAGKVVEQICKAFVVMRDGQSQLESNRAKAESNSAAAEQTSEDPHSTEAR